jgi:hypothetical protein
MANELQWSGYILPRSYTKEVKSLPYTTSLTATDGLADLKNLDFHTEQDWLYGYKTSIRGRISQLDAFRICLSKLKINQGFRIACNIFDTSHITTNNSPLNQTQINSNVYTEVSSKTRIIDGELESVEEPSYTSCHDVLTDILTIYKAIMVSWDGYWYIVDQEELLNTTINYTEYSSIGAYVGTGSLTPQIAFKTAQSTSRWRWTGTQTANTTDVFRNLILNINLYEKEQGILNKGSIKTGDTITVVKNRANDASLPIVGFWGLRLFSILTEELSTTYLLFNDAITYSGEDTIKLIIDSKTRLTYGRRTNNNIPDNWVPPYLGLRWSLKVNDKYTSSSFSKGSTGNIIPNWSTTETINTHYITNYTGEEKIELDLPFDSVPTTTSTYQLRVYIPNLYDYDYEGNSESTMLDVIRAITTTTLTQGFRIITRHFGDGHHSYYYYELGSSIGSNDDVVNVIPTTLNTSQDSWNLIHTRIYPDTNGSSKTDTQFTKISLNQNPKGFAPPEQVQLTATLNSKNKIDVEREVNIFDSYSAINNAVNIYENHTTFTDGTATSAWTKTGGSIPKTLQEWLLNYNTKLLKQPRQVINGNFTSDVQVTPLSTLKDAGSGNKIYYIGGLTLNDYNEEYSGEIIEIGSDDTPSIGAFTLGFEQDAVT